jgi:1-acyl-sn-glycerol-3-phosphate acyltransferase
VRRAAALLLLAAAPCGAAAGVVAIPEAPVLPLAASAAAAAPTLAASPLREAPALAAPLAQAPVLAAAVLPAPAARPAARLQVLSAEELGLSPDPEAPRPPVGERRPFLYRNYRALRRLVAPFLRLGYAVTVEGRENLPAGPVVLVPNHASYLDPVLVSYAANRPLRFLMARGLYETRGARGLLRSLGVIPISHKDPKPVIEEALNRARRALAAGESVAIFPEGRLSRDGELDVFRGGFARLARGLGVPVVPVRVDGMWGSVFSLGPGRSWARGVLARLLGRRRRVRVRLGPALARPEPELARAAVERLGAPR